MVSPRLSASDPISSNVISSLKTLERIVAVGNCCGCWADALATSR